MIILALIFALQADWRADLPAMGWTRVAMSADTVVFIQPGPRPNLYWERMELREVASSGFRSAMSLVEVDCSGGRRRFIQGSYYRESSFGGPTILSNSDIQAWEYPGPGTIGAKFFEAACE
jgi:hypothetical protein